MITLRLMQDFHGPEEKPPHNVWVLGPSGPNSVHAPTQNTLTFQTPEDAVLALMPFDEEPLSMFHP
jgi:hypothetical protein